MYKKPILFSLSTLMMFIGVSIAYAVTAVPSDEELIAKCRLRLAAELKVDDGANEEDVFECALDLKERFLPDGKRTQRNIHNKRFNRPLTKN